jgi:hypothetical protein
MGRAPVIWLRDDTRAWYGRPRFLPYPFVPVCPTEADLEVMHAYGPDSQARGGFAAYAQWLALVNPPARQTPMGGAGQPVAPCR